MLMRLGTLRCPYIEGICSKNNENTPTSDQDVFKSFRGECGVMQVARHLDTSLSGVEEMMHP